MLADAPSHTQMSDAMVDLVSARLRALADPMRIRLLDELRRAPATVGELADHVASSPQNVSRHLALMHREGMLSREKQGNFVRYSLEDPSVAAICDLLCGAVTERVASLGHAVGGLRHRPDDPGAPT